MALDDRGGDGGRAYGTLPQGVDAAEVADAFCATRLGGDGGRAYGTLPPGVDAAAIVERHRPLLG